jgi:hypothetical protein
MKLLRKQLEHAQGRSEFVIAVFCDVRGFSAFSTKQESPETAMYIKRFYIGLMDTYFADANFVKPTGDGLLLVFKYDENNLETVAHYVIFACLQALSEYNNLFKNDPMINFEFPKHIGFGIARGTASCLYSKKTIIDYSGNLLNLSARLTDLARPNGIVIDGKFQLSVIPKEHQKRFKTEKVYVRSIAEEHPIEVMYSDTVSLPASAKYPLQEYKWSRITKQITTKELLASAKNYLITLPAKPISREHIKVRLCHPSLTMKDHTTYREQNHEYFENADGPTVRLNIEGAQKNEEIKQLKPKQLISFQVDYVPRTTSKH